MPLAELEPRAMGAVVGQADDGIRAARGQALGRLPDVDELLRRRVVAQARLAGGIRLDRAILGAAWVGGQAKCRVKNRNKQN